MSKSTGSPQGTSGELSWSMSFAEDCTIPLTGLMSFIMQAGTSRLVDFKPEDWDKDDATGPFLAPQWKRPGAAAQVLYPRSL